MRIEDVLKDRGVQFVAVSVLSCSAGAASAWFVAKKHYKRLYEEEYSVEYHRMRAHFKKLEKKEEYSDPVELASKYPHPDAPLQDEDLEVAVDILRRHQYVGGVPEDALPSTDEVEGVVEEEEEESAAKTEVVEGRNVFDSARVVQDDFDYDSEIASRTADRPYIIHHDEYMENEHGYTQTSLVYFEGDGVLVDERDQPIDDSNGLVGDDNIVKFGHGSKDNNIVYIRNDRLQLDLEVARSDGKYVEEVLGFMHSDEPQDYRRKPRKFRGDDE